MNRNSLRSNVQAVFTLMLRGAPADLSALAASSGEYLCQEAVADTVQPSLVRERSEEHTSELQSR